VRQQGWGIWSPLSSALSASGGIAEILHEWACKVDSGSQKLTED
jgi:hypothetical protein